jgi:hypothetical protein
MIPLFIKAIRPAAPVNDPAQADDDLPPGGVPAPADGEDAGPPRPIEAPADPEADAPGTADDAPGGDSDAENAPADAPGAAPDAENGAADAPGAPAGGPPPMSYFTELLALIAERAPGAAGAEGGFGPDTVKPGHHVAFSAGEFSGSGKVHAVGADGVTVHDGQNRKHTVHWSEVTGHYAGEDGEEGDPADAGDAKDGK